jgi:hypothetical protein
MVVVEAVDHPPAVARPHDQPRIAELAEVMGQTALIYVELELERPDVGGAGAVEPVEDRQAHGMRHAREQVHGAGDGGEIG